MIDSQHGRRVFALQVAGLEYRYHSNTPPTSSNLDSTITTGISYVDLEGLVSVSDFSASVDPSGGVAEYDAITLTLGIDKRRGGVGDAGIIFGRCGARSSVVRSQLSSSASRDAVVFNTSSDLSSLTFPRLMHIGAETVRAASATTTTVSVARSVGGTPRQAHAVGLEGSSTPELSDTITTFRGRLAKLFMAHRYPSGSTSDYVEVCNGFISESPYIEEGDTVSISMLPLTALIDTSLADKGIGQTRLLQGYHYYDGFNGSGLEYILMIGAAPQSTNEFIELTPDTASSITASTFQLIVNNQSGGANLLDDFDPSLAAGPDADDFIEEHPRFPKFRRQEDFQNSDEGVFTTALSYSAAIPGYVVNADSTPTNALSAGQISATDSLRLNLGKAELKQHSLGVGEVKQWPAVINDTLESDGPSSASGYSGGVAKWRLTPDHEVKVEKLSSSPFSALVALFTTRSTLIWARDNLGIARPRAWSADTSTLELPDVSRLVYPFQYFKNTNGRVFQQFGENAPLMWFGVVADGTNLSGSRELPQPPAAYYQQYENVILVENSLGLPSSPTSDLYDVVVRYYDLEEEAEREQVFTCTHETTASFGGSSVGVLLHISDSNNFPLNFSFGDWPDQDRALIFRGGQLTRERPGEALLKLLESGGGGRINGTYDTLGVGLNLDSSHIDEDSFLAVDSAASLPVTGNLFGDGQDVKGIVEGILKMLGAVITMARDESTGLSRLTLVPVGFEKSAATVATVEAGDWIADPPPYWGIYEDIVTQVVFKYDFNQGEQDYESELIFNNQEAISRYGGERSKITIEVPGVSSLIFGRGAANAFSYFLPTSSRIFNLLSNPLRTWTGEIGTGQSAYMDVGAYVKVSSPHLRGYSDSYGVTDGVGMIRAIRQSLENEGCQLEIINTGLAPVNWNSSARVSSITSPTVILVEANAFTSSGSDISFFSAGDVVQHLPKGDQDNPSAQLTIDSILGNKITFTTAHGISSTGGTIEPVTYAAASTTHKEDAYLANTNDIINVTISAQEYN